MCSLWERRVERFVVVSPSGTPDGERQAKERESIFRRERSAKNKVIRGCCEEEGGFGFIMAILVDLGDSPARDRAGSMQMCKGFTISIAEGADL